MSSVGRVGRVGTRGGFVMVSEEEDMLNVGREEGRNVEEEAI